jgi:UrcA family protein
MTKLRIALATALVAVAAVDAQNAVASDSAETVFVTAEGVRATKVRYDDLRIEARAGAKALYGRVRAAAKAVCGNASSRLLGEHMDALECRREALAAAVDKIGSVQLAAIARETTVG